MPFCDTSSRKNVNILPCFVSRAASRVFSLAVPGCLVILLSACTNDFLEPFSLPTGYVYHGQTYKAPPGPELVRAEDYFTEKIDSGGDFYVHGYIVDPQDDALFLSAVSDLLRQLVDNFGLPTEPVYLRPTDDFEPLNARFEGILHRAMAPQGFTSAYEPGMGPFTIIYGVTRSAYGGDGNLRLSLSLVDRKESFSEAGGAYTFDAREPVAPLVLPDEIYQDEVYTEDGASGGPILLLTE